MKLTFKKARETKNKVRYEEELGDVVGTIYIAKEFVAEELGDSEVILVTIEVEK